MVPYDSTLRPLQSMKSLAYVIKKKKKIVVISFALPRHIKKNNNGVALLQSREKRPNHISNGHVV